MRRTAILPGEFLPSLFIRLAKLNYYATPDTLSQILREGVDDRVLMGDRTVFPRQAETYHRLANLTGVRIPGLYAASAHHFAPAFTSPGHPMKFLEMEGEVIGPLLAPSLAAKQLRPAYAGQFCPACLRNAAYHRLVWMPFAVSACLEHSCLLKDRCQQCNKRVSIREIVAARCRKCKGELTEAEVTSLHDDAGLLFQRVIQSWFMENATPVTPIFLLPEQQSAVLYRIADGLQWAARMLMKVKWPYMHWLDEEHHNLALEQDRDQRTITPYESFCLYTTAGKGMMNWPEGFYEFLDAYRSQVQEGKPLNGGPKADLGNLYTQWLQDYWRHPAFAFVHQAFEQYFIRTYSLSSAIARTNLCQENPEVAEQLPYVNIAEAARLLGTTPKMINTLLKTRRLTCQTPGFAGKRNYRLISRAAVLELRNRWNEVVNRAEAAEWLGVTEQMIIDLVKANLLSAEHYPEEGYSHWAFSRPALADCREKVFKYVESCSPPTADKKDTFVGLIGAARILFVVSLNAVAILRRVAEGKLRAYHIAGQKLNLGLLLFKRFDIEQYIQAIKSENGWISREALTKLLRVKDVTLTRWVREGLILPAAIYGGAQYFHQEVVEKFIADHVTTEEAVKILGIGKLTIQKWARKGRLSSACISGPHIDGYHCYIFHRGKLVQWRSERLTFGEAARQLGVSCATLHRWVQEERLEPLNDMGGEHRWFSTRVIQLLQHKTNKGSI